MREIYIPMEIFQREYVGKLALALALSSKGARVFIGGNHAVKSKALKGVSGSVYFETKGMSPKGMDHLLELRKIGFTIIGQDEEAGISFKEFSSFAKTRPELNGIAFFDKFFAWGDADYNFLEKEITSANIVKSGSARTLFWGGNGKEFYDEKKRALEAKYGPYVLLVSNLGLRNNLMSKRQMKKYTIKSGYGVVEYSTPERENWELKAFEIINEIIEKVSEDTNFRLLLRPHPTENSYPWEEKFKDNSKVIVSKEGNFLPVALAASHILHAGSTAAIEAMLCQKSTISFQSLIEFEDEAMLANYYCQSTSSIQDLVEKINSGEEFLALEGFYKEIRSKVQSYNDPKIVFDQAEEILATKSNKSLKFETLHSVGTRRDAGRIERLFDRIKYGKSDYELLDKNKRPRIGLDEIDADSKRIIQILGLSTQVSITEISDSFFMIQKK
jgi:surface carbohydrate biosynthesis protein